MPASCWINTKYITLQDRAFKRAVTYYKYTQSYADTNKSKDLAATTANGHLKRHIQ